MALQTSPGSSPYEQHPAHKTTARIESPPGPEQVLALLDHTTAIAASERSPLPILFRAQSEPPRPWRSYGFSALLHACAVALILIISIPVSLAVRHRAQRVTFLAPKLEAWKPKPPRIVRPRPPHFLPLPQAVRTTPAPVKLEAPARVQMATAPIVRPAPVMPEVKIQVPEPPREKVLTGVFGQRDVAKTAPPSRQVTPAGFGDPQGVRPQSQPAAGTVAKLGSFEMSNSAATGQATRGVVAQTGFGSIDGANASGAGTGHVGTVRAGGFGDGSGSGSATSATRSGTVHSSGFDTRASAGPKQAAAVMQPVTTRVEVLFKPKPAYTEDARNLKIEGQVALEVVFQAAGTVRIVRVIRGLGHGLDEAAEQAAAQVRFRPATRGGVPVDINATLFITFQLT